MAITMAFAGVPVADYPAARDWYERLLGRAPDVFPHERECMWRLTDTSWIYVVADAERAGNALVTILVDDLERHVAGLEGRGMTIEPIETLPGKVRRTTVTDPEGNRIQFGEPVGDR